MVKSRIDTLIYLGPISYNGFDLVVQKSPHKKGKNVLVILVTLGGDADAAYRIIQFLLKSYNKVTVYIPSLCKSAGHSDLHRCA